MTTEEAQVPKIPVIPASDRLPGLGAAIRSARENYPMTAAELSEAVDIHRSALHKIEQGERLPSVTVLVAIATTLGVSLDSLAMPA